MAYARSGEDVPLTTQIYFDGDKYNSYDPWWRESLTIRLQQHVDSPSNRIEWRGGFDIALQPSSRLVS
jgi:protocatechuate 3,4-dioxygenase beta subunit